MDYLKHFEELDKLNCSYDVRNEIQRIIFSGMNNADDTAVEQNFADKSQKGKQWIDTYAATVLSIIDSEPHSNECIKFFNEN
jgi:hypothetical protein